MLKKTLTAFIDIFTSLKSTIHCSELLICWYGILCFQKAVEMFAQKTGKKIHTLKGWKN